MSTVLRPASPLPLTTLSEDETMFRDAVRDFAESELTKHVGEGRVPAHFDAG